ncbi:glycosyltransferase family 9 protein [Sphingomonas arantia]|uniref:Glycosyltransferase family 9 protein n=1 Tax=Sphingomonas arantia TaxID=1460676 RepID=A0ABW4U0A2_9SPHN
MPVLKALGLHKLKSAYLANALITRARAAKREQRFAESAVLYQEALRLTPNDRRAQIQCGNMLKDAGRYAEAEAHYLAARQLRDGDAELELQVGHLHKLSGRLPDAQASYIKAMALRPGWSVPETELAKLTKAGWLGQSANRPVGAPPLDAQQLAEDEPDDATLASMRLGRDVAGLAPSLAPRSSTEMLSAHANHVQVKRLGHREPSFWGDSTTLRGVEAIHGFVISDTPIDYLQIIMNGLTIHRGPVQGGYDIALEIEPDRRRKYVFNIWMDFATFTNGRYAIELRFFDIAGKTLSHHDRVVVADPLIEADHPRSDAIIEIPRPDPRSVRERVNARESVVRPADRSLLPTPPRNILVQRTDQLGDMVTSIPAMRRLRELFPDAHIVGLLTIANEAFARTLDVFDEIIVVDFPDDPVERRRLMPLDAQEALRARLVPYAFDIALDLAQSDVSRPLLQLAAARFTLGFGGSEWSWLSANFVFNTHDPLTNLDIVPHSAKMLAMVEALGVATRTNATVMRRPELSRAQLAAYGIDPDERYVVLHAGARIGFSRWPHYPALARMILDRTGHKVVLLTEDADTRATLPADLLASGRFVLLDRRLPFDDLDAILSFCDAMVGNDSGPKHLAALRGANVVTLFTNRINSAEWGQELGGKIITRRVPCAGCLIFHDAEECGADFACIRLIKPEEVFGAISEYLRLPAA